MNDIIARLRVRRDAREADDRSVARVVSRDRELEIAVELVREDPQEADPTEDVLSRIADVSHLHERRRVGHELHQTPRARDAHGARVVVALAPDDGADELLGDLVERRGLADQVAVPRVAGDVVVARRDGGDAGRGAATLAAVAADVEAIALVAAGGVREVDRPVGAGVREDVGAGGRRGGAGGSHRDEGERAKDPEREADLFVMRAPPIVPRRLAARKLREGVSRVGQGARADRVLQRSLVESLQCAQRRVRRVPRVSLPRARRPGRARGATRAPAGAAREPRWRAPRPRPTWGRCGSRAGRALRRSRTARLLMRRQLGRLAQGDRPRRRVRGGLDASPRLPERLARRAAAAAPRQRRSHPPEKHGKESAYCNDERRRSLHEFNPGAQKVDGSAWR